MKSLIVLLMIGCSSITLAQSKYEQGMTKALELLEANNYNEASNLFQRIATAEKDNWLPYYYVAQTEILKIWNTWEERDEAMLKAQTSKAQEFLNTANSFTSENVYIKYLQAQLHTIWVAHDGMKYGMFFSPKVTELYEGALALEPNNPMLILAKAEWDMGAASFFGTSTAPYCQEIERAISLLPTFTPATPFHPFFGQDRAAEVLERCKS
ncbi:MAG: hypothetical protein ABNH00_09430 [Dokdonia sp.]|jgi:hypothetical protein